MSYLDFLILNPPNPDEKIFVEYCRRVAPLKGVQVNTFKSKVKFWMKKQGFEQSLKGIRGWLDTNPDYPNLIKTKEILDANGNVLTTTKSLRKIEEVDTSEMEVIGVTELSYGGVNVRYRKKKNEEKEARDLSELLAEKFKDFKPPTFKIKRGKLKPCEAVLNLFDAHLDKISFKSETGEDNTLEGNIKRFTETFDLLLSQAATFKPEQIVIPIGNDLFHTDNFSTNGKTTKGTEIEYYCNPNEAYKEICIAVINVIYKALAISKVKVIFVAGNHDHSKIDTLGFWLDMMFKKVNGFSSDNSRQYRKYHKYGKNLLGFTHGDKTKPDKLPILMAQDEPVKWGETKFRHWYCGHLHHTSKTTTQIVKDYPGVQVEYLRAMSSPDRWHTDSGWVGIPKSASATIWDRDKGGDIATFRINIA